MAVTATAKSWLQSSFQAPAAATIRIAIAGGGGSHDWAITAGTSWDCLDDLVTAWNTALAGAAVVALTANVELHQARVYITTGTGAAYDLTWSQAGDGTAVRDRLGSTGNLAGKASASLAWNGVVLGAFCSWVGFGRLVRDRTGISGGAAARTMNGTIVSQHSRDGGAEPVEMEAVLRWSVPPEGSALLRFAGHLALEAFVSDLYSAANTPSDAFVLVHADAAGTERWRVRLADDRVTIRPSCLIQPHTLFEVSVRLDVIEAPL